MCDRTQSLQEESASQSSEQRGSKATQENFDVNATL